MIVLDIESTGPDITKCGIWQIGAVDFYNPTNTFLKEARIDQEDIIDNSGKRTVYEVTGKTEDYFRDINKQSQKQLLENFFEWCMKIKSKGFNFICQNPQFDVNLITAKAKKYNLEIPYHYRAFDLHSVAQSVYFKEKGEFLLDDKGNSNMGLTHVLKFCGIDDPRKAHNALEDAKLTAECFSRMIYKKNLIEDYKNFPIPEYLK